MTEDAHRDAQIEHLRERIRSLENQLQHATHVRQLAQQRAYQAEARLQELHIAMSKKADQR